MNQSQSELELAWKEVSLWQDYVIRWKTEHDTVPEPRILQGLENAWRRYEEALQALKRPTTL